MADAVFAIVPCYNEGANIGNTLSDLLKTHPNINIVAVNDGSSDNTSDAISALQNERIVLLELPFNSGIGTAVETGLLYAVRHNADYAIKFDGDGQHLSSEIDLLLEPLRSKKADLTIGSRFLGNVPGGFKSTFMRRLGIRFFSLLSWILTGKVMTDSTSGFRAYNREALAFAVKYYPAFDYPEPEENILFLRNRFRIQEVPCKMNIRESGRSSIKALKAIYYMVKVSLSMIMAASRSVKQERKNI